MASSARLIRSSDAGSASEGVVFGAGSEGRKSLPHSRHAHGRINGAIRYAEAGAGFDLHGKAHAHQAVDAQFAKGLPFIKIRPAGGRTKRLANRIIRGGGRVNLL